VVAFDVNGARGSTALEQLRLVFMQQLQIFKAGYHH
jgi:hypothetical protein